MSGEIATLGLLGIFVFTGLLTGSAIYFYFFRLWFSTHIAQCSLPLSTIFGMFFRRVSPQVVVNSYVNLHKAGLEVTVEELEAHFKDGGNVRLVSRAVVAAKKNGVPVDFSVARKLDLAGKDVMEEIGAGAELASVAHQ